MIKRLVTGVVAAGLMAAGASAGVRRDAFGSFDGVQGSGGFTWGSTDGSALSPFTAPSGCAALLGDVVCLNDGGLPGVFRSTAGAFEFGSVAVPADRLVIHPGADRAVYGTFTVPLTARYRYRASLDLSDRTPTGVTVSAFSALSGNPLRFRPVLARLNAANPSVTFGETIVLRSGDVIGVVVGNGGNYSNDAVGFRFAISQVPDGPVWAMLVAGFGLAGNALRRSRGATLRRHKSAAAT